MPKPMTIAHTNGLFREACQYPGLPLVVMSPQLRLPIPANARNTARQPRRIAVYLLFWVIEGESIHNLDMEIKHLRSGNLLVVQPNQIHQALSERKDIHQWYKLAFEESCLSMLPQAYDFLQDPHYDQVLSIGATVQSRLAAAFESLAQLLSQPQSHSANLILAHLNVLLTELNEEYLHHSNGKYLQRDGSPKIYREFKQLIERDFKTQKPIGLLAQELCVSENRLYSIVKEFSGLSPKAFLTKRILLEAQRIFYYDRSSVKEAAFELGFSDPDHFSKLFRNEMGKTPTAFMKEVQDLYSK